MREYKYIIIEGDDLTKINVAAKYGWRVVSFTREDGRGAVPLIDFRYLMVRELDNLTSKQKHLGRDIKIKQHKGG